MEDTANASPQKPVISRRTFAASAAAALGSVILEPLVSTATGNTYLLPGAASAYGAEPRTVTVEAGQFCVLVYNPLWTDYEGDAVYYRGVRGAEIEVSNAETKLQGTTNSDGCAFFYTKDFAEATSPTLLGTYCEFFGEIAVNGGSATGDILREAHYPCVEISDAMAIAIPVCKIGSRLNSWESFDFYCRTLSMDGWNVLYQKQEFIASSENTSEHKLYVELVAEAEGSYVAQPVISQSSDSGRVGLAIAPAQTIDCRMERSVFGGWIICGKACFTGDFFNTESGNIIYPGETVSLTLRDANNADATTYTYETGISVCCKPCVGGRQEGDTIISLADNYALTKEALTKCNAKTDGLMRPVGNIFTLSKRWPGKLAGAQLNFWTPSLPVIFKYDPIGRIVLGVDVQLFDFNNLPTEPDGPAQWHKASRTSLAKQWDNKVRMVKKGWQNFQTWKNNPKCFSYNTWFTFVDLSVRFQFLTDLTYNEDVQLWDGEMRTAIGVALSISYVANATFMFIPLYVQVDFNTDLTLVLSSGVQSRAVNTTALESTDTVDQVISRIERTKEESLMPTFHAKLAASLAAGFANVVGIGIRAYGGISFSIQYRLKKVEGKRQPRFIFGYEYGICAFVMFLAFEAQSSQLWGDSNDSYYDSDDESATASALEADFAGEGARAESLFALEGEDGQDGIINVDDMKIVTDATLEKRAEVVMTSTEEETSVLTASVFSEAGEEDGSVAAGVFSVNDFTACGSTVVSADISSATMTTPAAVSAGTVADANGEGAVAVANGEGDGTRAALSRFANEANVTYQWPEEHQASPNDRGSGKDIIKKLGDNGGVEPRYMDLVAKDVFSGPFNKLVEVGSNHYLFRLAAVTHNGVTRNRVVCQRISNGDISKPFPIDFQDQASNAAARSNFYDYDFDVKLINKQKSHADIILMVFSGERPEGDKSTIYSVAEATVLSAVHLVYNEEDQEKKGYFTTKSCKTWHSKTYEETNKYYTFINPHVHTRSLNFDEPGFNRLGTDGFEHAIGYFLIYAASSKEKLLSPSDEGVEVGLGVVHMSFGASDELQVASVALEQGANYTVVDSLMPHPSDAASLYATLGYGSDKGSGVKALKLTLDTTSNPNKLAQISAIDIIGTDALVKSLSPWNAQNSLLASVSTKEDINALDSLGYLALCTLPTANEIESIEQGTSRPATFDTSTSCISPKNIPLGNVHIDAMHKYCYFADNYTGGTFFNYTEDGYEPCTAEASYVIKAITLADGVFTDPFVFADCGDYPVDTFCVVEDTSETSGSLSQFVTCSIDDTKSADSNLYHFTVPFLACVGVESAYPTGEVVYDGETARFSVTLKNYGNTVLTGAVLNIYENGTAEGEALSTIALDFAQAEIDGDYELLQTSYYEDAMSDETKQSALVANSGNAALIPGQTKTFVISVPIPEGWSGEKELIVHAASRNTTIIDPGTSDTTSATDSKYVEVYEFNDISFAVAKFDVATSATVEPDYGTFDGDTEDEDGDGKDGGSDGGKKGGSGTPGTGDALGGITPLLAGIAAAGTALAAYSARRTRLENGSTEEEE